MDIVLINGVNFSEDNTEPQLGLIALKKVLNETFNVDIINFDTLYNQKKFFYTDDVNENIQEMAEYICRLNPRIASFYTICNTYPITILLAEKIKEINSEITVVFGGPQATLTSKETLENYPFVDIVARGEGETYITELVSAILKKSSLATVKGVAYRDEKGSICLTEMPSIIKGEELKEYTVLDLEQHSSLFHGPEKRVERRKIISTTSINAATTKNAISNISIFHPPETNFSNQKSNQISI